MKWQRKLGSPKPDETFHDLLARARMMEEYEKQFAVPAEVQANSGRPSGKQAKKGVHSSRWRSWF